MKRSIYGALVLVAAVALLASPQAFAACTVDTQPVANGLNTWISNCPDANPVQGYIYLLGSTTVNSGAQDVICEADAGSNTIGQDCQIEAGTAGDGNVTILTDWGLSNPTIAGCPNTDGVPGHNPIAIQIICNDGKSAIIQTGYADFYTGYLMEMALPAAPNVNATTGPTPRILSSSGNLYNIHLTDMDDPNDVGPAAGKGLYSDCDGTAQGVGYSCPDPADTARNPQMGRGRVYTKDGPCGAVPDTRIAQGAWVLPPQSTPDAAGNIQATIDKPAAGLCRFVGASNSIGLAGGPQTETQAVTGAFVLVAAGAQTDKFKIDGASFKGNDVKITFSTENEAALVGFNVFAGDRQLNAGTIPAQGGSKSYTFETTRGALKGNKAVVLEGVFADGTKSKGPAFQVK